mmetsp:Transcript_28071/g.21003  ORF Transcript_28071/g.21003 Transcript_28071/m.21003 type:complete len:104 (+) Transcript_28071:138-449(+)
MAIGNKTIPRVYLLPPGEVQVKGSHPGDGNFTKSESGQFVHSGGWLFVHDNNSVEINLLECCEKEKFAFDKLDQCHSTETETAAGRVGAALQEKTVKILNRRR